MTDITAVRGTGDRPADDIIEPLLTTTEAKLERARNELDNGELASIVRIEGRYQPNAFPGLLIQISDSAQGGNWRGIIASVEHRMIQGGVVTAMEIWRPDEQPT